MRSPNLPVSPSFSLRKVPLCFDTAAPTPPPRTLRHRDSTAGKAQSALFLHLHGQRTRLRSIRLRLRRCQMCGDSSWPRGRGEHFSSQAVKVTPSALFNRCDVFFIFHSFYIIVRRPVSKYPRPPPLRPVPHRIARKSSNSFLPGQPDKKMEDATENASCS